MFEYHGWLSSFESVDVQKLLDELHRLNGDYPASARHVNGKLHISFSGNPNRDIGILDNIVSFLCGLDAKLYGCIYINDANSEGYNRFSVIKIVEDQVIKTEDKNFTLQETKQLFD